MSDLTRLKELVEKSCFYRESPEELLLRIEYHDDDEGFLECVNEDTGELHHIPYEDVEPGAVFYVLQEITL